MPPRSFTEGDPSQMLGHFVFPMAGTSGAAAKKREELGNSLLKLGDEQATFLLKIKALIDEYRVVQPSLTIQYEVRELRMACQLLCGKAITRLALVI